MSEMNMSFNQESHMQQLHNAEAIMERQGRSWGLTVVHAIADAVKEELERLSALPRMSELRGAQTMDNVAYRLTRETTFQVGNQQLDTILKNVTKEPASSLMDVLLREVRERVDHEVAHWWDFRDVYFPPHATPGVKAYATQLKKAADMPTGDRPVDRMNELQQMVDERFPSSTRPLYDHVRSAEFGPIVEDDAPDIVASYADALIDSATLNNLVHKSEFESQADIQKRIDEFRNRMMTKGGFVHELLLDEFVADLKGKAEQENGMPLVGWRLRATEPGPEQGKLLGWFTVRHARSQKEMKRRRQSYIEKFLAFGSTGGRVEYYEKGFNGYGKKLKREWDTIELYQDTRCHKPFVSERLACHGFEVIHRANPELKHMLAYHLFDLQVEPPLDLDYKQGIFRDENRKSFSMFYKLGFFGIATDFNSKPNAPKALRTNVGGIDRYLNPKWQIICGNMKDIVPQARKNWRVEQIRHGDFSIDQTPDLTV